MCSLTFLDLCSSLVPYNELISEEVEAVKPFKLALLQELKDHKLYFYTWLTDEPITHENKKKLLKRLYEFVEPVPKKDEKLAEITKTEMTTYQRPGSGLIEAFIHIQTRKFGAALRVLNSVEKFLIHCELLGLISPEYCVGFKIVASLLRIHLSIVDGSVTDKEVYNRIDLLTNGIASFQKSDISELERLEMTAVLVVKWQLGELFQSRKVEGVEILEKIFKLDPENWVWGYLLCLRVRFMRRQNNNHDKSLYPDPREIEGMNASLKYAPEIYKPIPMAGVCLCLAEILRWRCFNSCNAELIFGEKTFQSNKDIANFIINTARDALRVEELVCFGEFIRYGEILSSTLPSEYQNLAVAEQCFENALEIMPNNSKANHKLGVLLIKTKDKGRALSFIERAVILAPHNFPALMDLIQLLLSEYEKGKNDDRLKEIFSRLLIKSKEWATPKQEGSILFLRGLYGFLEGDIDKAIICWVKRSKIDPSDSFPTFSNLHSLFKRYSFRASARTVLDGIILEVKQKLKDCIDPVAESELKHLLEKVEILSSPRRPRNLGEKDYDHPTNRTSKPVSAPFQMRQQRYRTTSEADSDDCWRTSSPASPGSHFPQQSQSQNAFSNSSYGRQGKFQRNYSDDTNRNYSGGNRHWQQPRGSRTNRSPSPDSWR